MYQSSRRGSWNYELSAMGWQKQWNCTVDVGCAKAKPRTSLYIYIWTSTRADLTWIFVIGIVRHMITHQRKALSQRCFSFIATIISYSAKKNIYIYIYRERYVSYSVVKVVWHHPSGIHITHSTAYYSPCNETNPNTSLIGTITPCFVWKHIYIPTCIHSLGLWIIIENCSPGSYKGMLFLHFHLHSTPCEGKLKWSNTVAI